MPVLFHAKRVKAHKNQISTSVPKTSNLPPSSLIILCGVLYRVVPQAKYGDESVYFDLDDVEQTVGAWDMYAVDSSKRYPDQQVFCPQETHAGIDGCLFNVHASFINSLHPDFLLAGRVYVD